MEARQLWNYGSRTVTVASTSTYSIPHCTPFTLPSNGVLFLASDTIVTLTSNAVFEPECTTNPNDIIITDQSGDAPSAVTDYRDPFYASTLPQCYALAATTVIAYMLVIMLVITPRTFLHRGAIVLGRRGFTNGPAGSDAVAALTVAISLSIATADTFQVAEEQYNSGIMDAFDLQQRVENGLELKIIRIISDTFLWLAQAQTLIRLFPRQREKIIIKWTAFALITLDVLFSILNTFVYRGASRPRSFVDAVPALAYLFQLTLSLLYCAWVMYYALAKRRVAFYHPQMRNQCLVALLSLASILIPVVFFVLDISKPTVAAWGDYVRWVGAAAASVVVWEWVERIECLERNDKKDGILGREVFDGDEMLDPNPPPGGAGNDKDEGGAGTTTSRHGKSWPGISDITSRYRHRTNNRDIEAVPDREAVPPHNRTKRKIKPLPGLWPSRPDPVATPVSRTDTASAESTVYAVRYHPISEPTPRPPVPRNNSLEITRTDTVGGDSSDLEKIKVVEQMEEGDGHPSTEKRPTAWQSFAKLNPFRQKTQGPPAEVSAYRVEPLEMVNGQGSSHRWDIRARIEDFAVTQADKLRERARPTTTVDTLPRTVIPAPARRRNLTAMLEEIEEAESEQNLQFASGSGGSVPNVSALRPEGHVSPPNPYPHRSLEDPYTPTDLNSQSIAQRGMISIVTTPQDQRSGGLESVSPSAREALPSITPSSSRTLWGRSRSSSHVDGLPKLSIPAPPRQPRSDED
ncbi:PalH/RIM21-domain-containing protein [Bisporella sp. PMI_857]|nr:PalH/RIM21-domain-containing protein [Bisporella sp. PMI_857]KAH8600491.1 PalH/RIM21-domain-containing protein [Bisporella sp. PMI_857]